MLAWEYCISRLRLHTSNTGEAAGRSLSKNPPTEKSSGRIVIRALVRRGSPGFGVDDLDAAVDRIRRILGILQFGLAIADRDQVGSGDMVVLHQIALDGVGAPLGQILVEGVAADAVGVAGDNKGRTLQARIGQRLAELLDGVGRALADLDRRRPAARPGAVQSRS